MVVICGAEWDARLELDPAPVKLANHTSLECLALAWSLLPLLALAGLDLVVVGPVCYFIKLCNNCKR